MSSTASPSTVFPPEVAAFASQRGVAEYLPAVHALTARVFPDATKIVVRLLEDPEIPDERHICFEVDVAGGLDPSRYAELDWQWSRELFGVCPATHVCLFGLHLNIPDP